MSIIKPPYWRRLNKGHPLARGLVGCWLMNEGAGNIIRDLSGRGHTGMFYGDTNWQAGEDGHCVDFPGSNDAIIVPNSSDFHSLHNLTVIAKVRVESIPYPSTTRLVHQNSSWTLTFYNFPNLIFGTYQGGWSFLSASTNINYGEWHTLCGVFDGDLQKRRVYVDGIKMGEDDETDGDCPSSSDGLMFGLDEDLSLYDFDGKLSYVMIYNRALSAAEIAYLYQRPFCMFHRKPIELWSAANLAAGDWLDINSSHIHNDSFCGESIYHTLAQGLNGTNYWGHSADEVHWFILDLGASYTITKLRGRSDYSYDLRDPTDVDVYISDDVENWGSAVATGIDTWQDRTDWDGDAIIDCTPKEGQYIKVVINNTESVNNYIAWGNESSPFMTIFDVYGTLVEGEYEDFTTYEVEDPNSRTTITSSKVSWNDLSENETAYVYKDKGVNYFGGDFTFKLEVQFSDIQGNTGFCFWAISNTLGDYKTLFDADEDFVSFHYSAGNFVLTVTEDGESTYGYMFSPSAGTTYYITITRDDDGGVNGTGRITAYIRTESHTGTLQDTLIVDCSAGEQNDFRYLFGLMSRNYGESDTGDGFTQNMSFDLEEVGGGSVVPTIMQQMNQFNGGGIL